MIEKRRFPRTDDVDLLFMMDVRKQYPAPDYNPHTDGSYNPADMIVDFHLNCSKQKMKELCRKHSLKIGSKRGMMKRMYLHWRASKLKEGDVYFGYGEGFESTKTPDCSCGYLKVEDWEKLQAEKEIRKESKRRQIRSFLEKRIYRFPRLPEGYIYRSPR